MIELLFTACLIASPERCEHKAMQFLGVSPMTCMVGAEHQLAAWAQQNPKWRVVRWQCRASFGEREA